MTDIKRVGSAGVHTVEGNVAGSRAARLTKARDVQKQEYEAVKLKIKQENAVGVESIQQMDRKFNGNSITDTLEQEFRLKTIGLVSADDFRKFRQMVDEKVDQSKANEILETERLQQQEIQRKKDDRDKKRKKIASTLSFGNDIEEADPKGDESNSNGSNPSKKKIFKDPSVDTSFLPDRDRDRLLAEQKELLKQEWLAVQEKTKNELLEVVYSYWDGSGHRKSITVKKGCTVGRFLELVKQQIAPEFSEVRSSSAEDFLYVKEDLIIPHHVSFYDLIVTKARGKSGPLFHFDVHDDVRLRNDATVEKDESHPGKVVERRWFEKNKHIFPASRWEQYDPAVSRDAMKYTIHGGELK
mmetsp:Transcript_26674/g.36742  ORF Transcript_26674/g.36742 Transcript_26674/m.36742 type:complete len:356 (-) Transcript_26674:61-1128(-)